MSTPAETPARRSPLVKIVLGLLGLLVAAIATVLGLALTKPDSFRVERSTTINASPDKVFALIEDLHRWEAWSPWEKLDPSMKKEYSGAERGPGAVYTWQGNSQVGEGRMEITEATPSSKVAIKLDFLKPFEAHNTTEFALTPEGDGTKVDWSTYGPTLFMGKVMQVFVSMDDLMGKDFEAGLAAMKAEAEKQ